MAAATASPPRRRERSLRISFRTAARDLLFDLGYGIGFYVLGIVAEHIDYANMYRFAALLVILSAAVYYILHHRRGRANAKATSAM